MTHSHAAACQNCHTALQGEYCHQCGQAAHNPLKSFAHAVEDVFESFWHLDGRIFRSLRELWIPGRVAANYLAGQRVRYLPPLRLFVILSLFAFLMARLSVSTDDSVVRVVPTNDPFASLTTPAEVVQQRDTLLAGLPVADNADLTTRTATLAARQAISEAATARIDVLQGRPPTVSERALDLRLGSDRQRPWHPVDNPVKLSALPGWANAAINQRMERLQANLKPDQAHWKYLLGKFIAALPAALIVMMPLLALVLRLLYWRRPMGYLEHLVVALYSHAWLLSVLFVVSALNALAAFSGVAVLGTVSSLLATALWLSVPVYLWCMQRRVYGGNWLLHSVRFATTAATYGVLVVLAALYAMAASLTS